MRPRHKRLAAIVAGLSGLTVAVALALSAFNDSIVFFYSPSQVAAGEAPTTRSFRVGGLVERGSLRKSDDGLTTYFAVTDTVRAVPVVFDGMLPDLFKEERGCVVQGRMAPDGVFHADQVLAKHDENYMPAEAARSIEDATRAARAAGQTLAEP
jgi:cytochrome c-type biogenesis protein CcmE